MFNEIANADFLDSLPSMPKPEVQSRRHHRISRNEELKRRYGLSLIVFMIWGASMILGCCMTGVIVRNNTIKELRQEMAVEYASQLEAYKRQQAEQAQAEHWLSGDASREAFINQEILAGAKLICREANDQVKGTKLGVALARVMNPMYPGTIKEVAEQPNQFMYYDDSNKVTEHDLDLAEQILRPYYEQGIVPNGLTQDMVYFEWSGNSGTARDSYETTTSMSTWRWQG